MSTTNKIIYFVIILFSSQLTISQENLNNSDGAVSEENLINRAGVAHGLPVTPIVPTEKYNPSKKDNDRKQNNKSINEMYHERLDSIGSTGVESIPLSSISNNGSYSANPNKIDTSSKEDMTDIILTKILPLFLLMVIVYFIYKSFKKFKETNDVQTIETNSNPSSLKDTNEIITQLEKIKVLRNDGIINEEEFK